MIKFIKCIISIIISVAVIGFLILLGAKLTTMSKSYYVGDKAVSISIFTYHDVVEYDEKVKDKAKQVSKDKFESQVLDLKYIGFAPINYDDLIDYYEGNKALNPYNYIVTFDEGYESIYNYVYPIVQGREIPIEIFVVDNKIGTEGYLSWEQLKEMQASGFVDIYINGLDYEDVTSLSARELLNRVNKAQDDLVTKLGNRRQIFAYPNGKYTNEQFELLKENGYIQNITDNKINISSNTDLYKLHRSYANNDPMIVLFIKQVIKSVKE